MKNSQLTDRNRDDHKSADSDDLHFEYFTYFFIQLNWICEEWNFPKAFYIAILCWKIS